FAIVNDRKLPLGNPMTVREAEQAFGFLFFVKDEGSRQTSLQRASFQGFSVRRSETFPLPEEIAALRCEAGPHEPEGHHLYMRLFYRDQAGGRKGLEDLGFTPEVASLFREIRMSKYGGIFIGGTTGDGKSTTLAVNLNLQMREHGRQMNMVTLEDPVEYNIPDAVQIAVPTRGIGEERGLGFAAALMHFVRVHPASGMVGEIRDKMGAQQVLQFIDSGHQVWTTIHVHTANGILFRLMDLGVEVSEVTKPGNVRLLMKQTLVPLLCPACALRGLPEGRDLPEELAGLLGPGVRYRNPEGCTQCRTAGQSALSLAAWAGYARPLAVAEWIVPDDGYLRHVQARDAVGAWNHWVDVMDGVPIGRKIWRAVGGGRVDPADAMLKGAEIAEAVTVFGPANERGGEELRGPGAALPGKPVLVAEAVE
ncbi:MAG: ATPase, T2SS/T4P/T4SS family, partial [Alphaproteobacteria bacterium]|nr:ATPase, T2SS/T4P/T4SS family [Alphaproteobacteria bacterium]